MFRKINIILSFVFSLFSINLLTICDPSIYDFTDTELGGLTPGSGIKNFLNPESCLNQLASDIEYLMEECFEDKNKSASQALTVLLSYAMFDMSLDSKTNSDEVNDTKVLLYEQIRLLFIYTNFDYSSIIGDIEIGYESSTVYSYCLSAIEYCEILQEKLGG